LKTLEMRLDIIYRGRHTDEVEVVEAVVPAPVEDEQALRRGNEGALHDVVEAYRSSRCVARNASTRSAMLSHFRNGTHLDGLPQATGYVVLCRWTLRCRQYKWNSKKSAKAAGDDEEVETFSRVLAFCRLTEIDLSDTQVCAQNSR